MKEGTNPLFAKVRRLAKATWSAVKIIAKRLFKASKKSSKIASVILLNPDVMEKTVSPLVPQVAAMFRGIVSVMAGVNEVRKGYADMQSARAQAAG